MIRNQRNGQRHLRLVQSSIDEPAIESTEAPSTSVDLDADDIAVKIDLWLESLRRFARSHAELESPSAPNSPYGSYGVADYPFAVNIVMGEITQFASHAFHERRVLKPGSGRIFSEEVIFEDFSSDEISEFLKGFKDLLVKVDALSTDLEKRTKALNLPDSSKQFQSFANLDDELRSEIVFQLLDDSLNVWRTLQEVGFDGEIIKFSSNNPALYFEPAEVSRAVNFGCRQRADQLYTKGQAGLLPGIRAAERIVANPVDEIIELLDQARSYVTELAMSRIHPSTSDVPIEQPGPRLTLVRDSFTPES